MIRIQDQLGSGITGRRIDLSIEHLYALDTFRKESGDLWERVQSFLEVTDKVLTPEELRIKAVHVLKDNPTKVNEAAKLVVDLNNNLTRVGNLLSTILTNVPSLASASQDLFGDDPARVECNDSVKRKY